MREWLKIDRLQKKIDDFQLGPIGFQAEPGTITTLVGNNGSGKSTLLKLIMHLAKADHGTIELFGEPVTSEEKNWKQHIAYMSQTMVGMDIFKGNELKDLTAVWYPDWDEYLFQEMIRRFHVPLHKKYNKLSQGIQQKLNLALTIASSAPFMILDEPTSFLDIPSKKILGDILIDWMDEGERLLIMTSHQVEDIRKFSDYITIMHDGNMLGSFEKGELQERFRRYWVRDDLPPGPIPGEIHRDVRQLATEDPEATERFFNKQGIGWYDEQIMDLEEIITILMTRNT